MVPIVPLILSILLATKRNTRQLDLKSESIGRKRYSKDGTKRKARGKSLKPSKVKNYGTRVDVFPLPPLTTGVSSRPTYFTCRHTYENTLINEIDRYALTQFGGNVIATSPYPGLVRVEDPENILPTYLDPVYALQIIPNAIVVSGSSIKTIAKEVYNALLGSDDTQLAQLAQEHCELRNDLLSASRGSLSIHPLVPGQCKAQTKPMMLNRSEKICDELANMLKKVYPAARKISSEYNNVCNEKWILQVMLQSPEIAVASLVKSKFVGPGNSNWPNIKFPLGLALVDIEEKMPSSAYRKLMEALECMQIRPLPQNIVVDLGACPGGWTTVMRKFGCGVISVDRSELDHVLMRDEMVEFVKGDAFTFEPPSDDRVSFWMVSDVIAYPDRITDLLNQWCSNQWADHMVVTMKFQGDEPSLDDLDHAIDVVKQNGYFCRAKHFFNNKNEVTLMISKEGSLCMKLELNFIGSAMYNSTI
jgi:23S rRNA C2498 (ribose-2'-O)-methylase RlmM